MCQRFSQKSIIKKQGGSMNTKHAVITDTHIVAIDTQQRKLVKVGYDYTLSSIGDVWQLGQNLGVTHFWIMPNSCIDKAAASFFSDAAHLDVFYTKDDRGLPLFGRCWHKERADHTVYVGYAHRGRFSWDVKHPLDILATIDYLTTLLGVDVQWSPGHIGTTVLKKMYSSTDRLKSYVRKADINLKELPYNKAARDVLFGVPLTMDMVGQWVHHYDKNSAYLGACRSVMNGAGTPQHIIGNIEPEKVGIYRVSYQVNASLFNGVTLPLIIKGEWVTRDVLKFALSKGYDVLVHEAYVYEESHRVLDKWAVLLWDSRTSLKTSSPDFPYEQARENAYHTIKEIALISVGKLASHWESEFMRPDWWADVVGMSRVHMLAHLEKYKTLYNVTPLLVYSDGVWYTSDNGNIETAFPDILSRKGQLGGYKDVYSVQITEEMVQETQGLKDGAMVSYFHKKAGYR